MYGLAASPSPRHAPRAGDRCFAVSASSCGSIILGSRSPPLSSPSCLFCVRYVGQLSQRVTQESESMNDAEGASGSGVRWDSNVDRDAKNDSGYSTERNERADAVMKRIQAKLTGKDFDPSRVLDVENQVGNPNPLSVVELMIVFSDFPYSILCFLCFFSLLCLLCFLYLLCFLCFLSFLSFLFFLSFLTIPFLSLFFSFSFPLFATVSGAGLFCFMTFFPPVANSKQFHLEPHGSCDVSSQSLPFVDTHSFSIVSVPSGEPKNSVTRPSPPFGTRDVS